VLGFRMGIAADLTFVIVAGLVGGILARLIGQPLVLGYLLAGVLLGPHAGGTISDVANLELLAELGVTLLLFGLGLELSIKEMAPVRAVALFGTTLQMTLTIVVGVGLGRALGLDWAQAVWLGALVSLSSTMVVLKTLQAQGRIGTLSSRVMLGMLVAQDIAVVPLMIVLPRLATPDAGAAAVAQAAVKAVVFLGLMVGVGTRVLPWLVERAARSGSRELFLLIITALGLGIGYVTHLFGLSSALGAFVAGLVLSESDYSHQALSDIIPLRDVFSLLFFASVGMLFDPAQLLGQWPAVVATVVVVGLAKGLIFAGVTWGFGYRNVIPLATGLGLFQVGEFTFVLARAGLVSGSLSPGLYGLVLNTALITMALTPIVAGLTTPVYGWISRRRERDPVQTINLPDRGLRDHVVIAGAGRVGSNIAAVLAGMQLPVVLIELDDRRLTHAREQGLPIVFGDATRPTVLEAARVESARLVLVTLPSYTLARSIVEHARSLNPTVPIVARADSLEAFHALRALGVEEAVQPELEAGLEMTRQALLHLRVPVLDILEVTDGLRHERYGPAYSPRSPQNDLIARLGNLGRLLDFKWVPIAAGSPLAEHTIGDLGIRKRTGASVVGAMTETGFVASPGPDLRLATGDLVAVVGSQEQLTAFERLAAPAVREPGLVSGTEAEG
jgi:CPA2 family monovalent cation:H+ antiporter-2